VSSRWDFWHDPSAPAATSLVPGACALVVDDARVLLQRRADSGNWSMPGGVMEIGETMAQAVVREVAEETGLDVEVTGLLGIYTDPGHVIAYSDGEVRQEFVVAYIARVVGGTLRVSDESTEVRFVELAEMDRLPVHESVRLRLRHWIEGRYPHLG
jgi:ADP-ribose pyrophosphatase YjhB (NUDIX family)